MKTRTFEALAKVTVTWQSCTYDEKETLKWLKEQLAGIDLDGHIKIKFYFKNGHLALTSADAETEILKQQLEVCRAHIKELEEYDLKRRGFQLPAPNVVFEPDLSGGCQRDPLNCEYCHSEEDCNGCTKWKETLAPNTPSPNATNTGVTHTPASTAPSTAATPSVEGQVEARDGKAAVCTCLGGESGCIICDDEHLQEMMESAQDVHDTCPKHGTTANKSHGGLKKDDPVRIKKAACPKGFCFEFPSSCAGLDGVVIGFDHGDILVRCVQPFQFCSYQAEHLEKKDSK